MKQRKLHVAEIDPKMHEGMQGTQNRQNNLEKQEQIWRIIPNFNTYYQAK